MNKDQILHEIMNQVKEDWPPVGESLWDLSFVVTLPGHGTGAKLDFLAKLHRVQDSILIELPQVTQLPTGSYTNVQFQRRPS